MGKNIYNNFKLAFHPSKLESFVNEKITAPLYVRVKPTNICNHHCFYCAYDNENPTVKNEGRKDQLPREKMIELLSDFKDIGVKAVTYSGGGEPLIYPHISDAFERTLNSGIDLSIITNGQKLSGKRADLLKEAKWVRVSLDSYDAQIFKQIRKVPEKWFSELINNIENFSKIKSPDCEFGINFVANEYNASKVYDSIKLFQELGADHIKITPRHIPEDSELYHEGFKEKVIGQITKARQNFPNFLIYDTYNEDFSSTSIPERKYSKCYIMQTVPVIAANGNVHFCHDKAWIGNGILGSIKEKSFKELWFSKKSEEIFKNFNPSQDCKHHCTNDRKNQFIGEILNDLDNLEKYKPLTTYHKNFI